MNEQNSPDASRETVTLPPEGIIPEGTPGQAFMRALQAMEKDRNVDHLVERFSRQCKLWRQSYAQPYEATQGARHFWDQYLNQFESIQTNFTHVMERDDLSILEWESQGVLQGGRPIHYRGVSILEFGDESKVRTFRTYFDSAHFINTHGQASMH